jgi:hypothetical protein
MKTYGELVGTEKRGFIVLLEDGNRALLPLEDVTESKYAETMLGLSLLI